MTTMYEKDNIIKQLDETSKIIKSGLDAMKNHILRLNRLKRKAESHNEDILELLCGENAERKKASKKALIPQKKINKVKKAANAFKKHRIELKKQLRVD